MAIQPVRDIGGLGRLAQTIQIKRAQDLEREKREGQLTTDKALTTGFADILASQGQFGPDRPVNVRTARLAAETPGASLSDLQNLIKLGTASQGGINKFQRGTGVLTVIDGEQFIATPVFDPRQGKTVVDLAPVSGTLTSKIGETPSQTQERAIATAGGSEAAKLGAKLETEPKIAGKKKIEEQRVTDLRGTVTLGRDAAQGIAVTKRAIELLELVQTGGVDAVRLRAKQLFGIETPDEGELVSLLGEAVLGDLRKTFGAQFTEKEGDRLTRIRAGIGKNPQANVRILQQTLELALRDANRGKFAAKELGDDFSFEDIDKLLQFQLIEPGTEIQPQAAAVALPEGVTQQDFDQILSENEGMTAEELLQILGAQ